MSGSSVTQARARLAAKTRHNPDGDHTEARRDLAAANLEAYVRRVVATAPPLTNEQRERLAVLLTGGRTPNGGDAA